MEDADRHLRDGRHAAGVGTIGGRGGHHACHFDRVHLETRRRWLATLAALALCGATLVAGQKRPSRNARGGAFDDFQIPAGTPLLVQLRTALDSSSKSVDDPVRATLMEPVTRDGVELIPEGSLLHGNVEDVVRASRRTPMGRIVLRFHVIEHAITKSLASIDTDRLEFDASPEAADQAKAGASRPKKPKIVDVTVPAGERVLVTLDKPLVVRVPR